MATSTYQAGFESNAVEISHGLEATWGVAPATTFQAIRATSESRAGKRQRTRPDEMRTTAEASAAVTQSESADGAINFALSYGTFDDYFTSLMNGSWSSAYTITGVSGDIAFAASGNTISSTTSGKFTNLVVGQWIRISGTASNNGYARIATKADNQTITVSGLTLVNETPAGAAAVLKTSGFIRNGSTLQTLFIQKKFSSSIWLTYPGSQVTGMQLGAQQGQFAQGSFNLMSKSETKATTDSSTGGVTAAPSSIVYNTVGQFAQLQLDGATVAAVVRGVSINVNKAGAAMDYGIGSSFAQGTRMGELTIDGGKLTAYFKDFTLYDLYRAEAQHVISWRQTDLAGNSLIFTLPAAVLNNPTIVAGGPNSPVMADFDIMADPDSVYHTLQIDRIAA
jgi:hypothetical protein